FWGPYSATKAALNSLALTYAAENVNNPLRVNLFNPGPIRTAMRAQAMPGEDPATLEAPEGPASAILALCLPSV
ncbi:SDR family NAD(P)-dependent oxidoreductase, partial [Stenotrophomonas maltophilia]